MKQTAAADAAVGADRYGSDDCGTFIEKGDFVVSDWRLCRLYKVYKL